LKIRKQFFKEFEKYKNGAFTGIDRQAMFTSTILHSLDHYLCSKYLPDPLLLDKNDTMFGKTAELCRIVRAGFVEKPPGFYFAHTYKSGGHDFIGLFMRRVKILTLNWRMKWMLVLLGELHVKNRPK